MELKEKMELQEKQYKHDVQVLHEELDKISREQAQQHIIYEGRIRKAEKSVEIGAEQVKQNNNKMKLWSLNTRK